MDSQQQAEKPEQFKKFEAAMKKILSVPKEAVTKTNQNKPQKEKRHGRHDRIDILASKSQYFI